MSACVYLDHASTSYPKPSCVYEAVDRYAREQGVGAARGSHGSARAAADLLASLRRDLGTLLGMPPEGVVLTTGATEALNLVLLGALRGGDHVVTTPWEHNAVRRPLEWLAQHRDVRVQRVAGSLSSGLDRDDLTRLLRPTTRLCVVNHVSNVFGIVAPVAEIVARVRERSPDALVVLDAAQSAGCLPLDAGSLGVDVVCFAGHKGLLGPTGTGGLALREGVAQAIAPTRFGGTGARAREAPFVADLPGRFEVGTQNTWGFAGLHAGVRHLLDEGVDRVTERVRRSTRRLADRLEELPGVDVLRPAARLHHGAVSFTVPPLRPGDVATLLDEHFDIRVRAGLHCAPWAHDWAGSPPGGTVRASVGWNTTDEDLDALVEALEELGGLDVA